MSTICCMLHLFGNRFGQKGSTLYSGGFCACATRGAATTARKETAMITAAVLVHRIGVGMNDSPWSDQFTLKLQLASSEARLCLRPASGLRTGSIACAPRRGLP